VGSRTTGAFGISEEVELEAGDALLLPTASVTCCAATSAERHRNRHSVRNVILGKTTVGAKADTEMMWGTAGVRRCGLGLTPPALRAVSVRGYNGQGAPTP
jgi:hypothetical protein